MVFFLNSANTVPNDPGYQQHNYLVKERMYKNLDLSNFCKGATNPNLHFLRLRSIVKILMGLDENMAGKKIVIYIELNPDNAVLLKKNIDF